MWIVQALEIADAEANACDRCDAYTASVAGFPSRQRRAEDHEARERAEYERLRQKFEIKPPEGG